MNTFKLFSAILSVSLIGGTAFFVDCNITNKVCVAPASVLSTNIDMTEPSPTAIVFQTPTHTPVPIKRVANPTELPIPTVDPNPLVSCNIHKDCGGGTKLMKQNECSNSVCCTFRFKNPVVYTDRNACNNDLQKEFDNFVAANPIPNFPTPVLTFSTPAPWPTIAPIVVPTINGSIHINNPEPTPAVPFGFSN